MEERFCDWHTHLNYSKDSPLSIAEYFGERLPKVTKNIFLTGVSITDHNTLRAYTIGEAERHIRQMNQTLSTTVKLLIGTELSLDVMIGGKKQHMHFLFYFPNIKGSLEKTAKWLEDGLLGDLMKRIVAQNNERHRIMAKKTAKYLGLSRGDAEALQWLIEKERKPAPETGREHIKRALQILFPEVDRKTLDNMFARSGAGKPGPGYTTLDEVKGHDIPYLEALEALKGEKEYRTGMVVMAHPWRYDLKFAFADKKKLNDEMLIDMSEFMLGLARARLIDGMEIHGYYPLPEYLQSMNIEELIEKKHARYTGTRYSELVGRIRKEINPNFVCAGGNDSHGEELPGGKPDIPIGYGCKETDPLPYYMTGVRHTPAHPMPSLRYQTK